MGKIVATEFISLDGVIEDPGGSEDFVHGGWTFEVDRGEEGDKFQARRGATGRGAAARPGHLRRLRGSLAGAGRRRRHGRLREEDEHDAEVRLLDHPQVGRLAEHHPPLRRLRQSRSRKAKDKVDGDILVAGSAPWSRD